MGQYYLRWIFTLDASAFLVYLFTDLTSLINTYPLLGLTIAPVYLAGSWASLIPYIMAALLFNLQGTSYDTNDFGSAMLYFIMPATLAIGRYLWYWFNVLYSLATNTATSGVSYIEIFLFGCSSVIETITALGPLYVTSKVYYY